MAAPLQFWLVGTSLLRAAAQYIGQLTGLRWPVS